jgi:hypothetical protein
MSSHTERPRLYLVGFRIEPDIFAPQLYTVYVEGDRPILREGQPILFVRPELAEAALQRSDCGAAAFGPAPSDLYTVYDYTSAIYTLNHKEEAENSELLDCINVLLDFCNCIDEPMPSAYRACLESLADHLTFNKEFASFLYDMNISRKNVTDALFWCMGMIIYWMKLLV